MRAIEQTSQARSHDLHARLRTRSRPRYLPGKGGWGHSGLGAAADVKAQRSKVSAKPARLRSRCAALLRVLAASKKFAFSRGLTNDGWLVNGEWWRAVDADSCLPSALDVVHLRPGVPTPRPRRAGRDDVPGSDARHRVPSEHRHETGNPHGEPRFTRLAAPSWPSRNLSEPTGARR